jgi:mitogen-activated protein kinase 1/3/mitogen-activated protein kinase 6
METDLASILKSPQPLSDDHCQFFLYQIFRGLKYVHSAMVIHRDLKPRNLLVNSNCDLKICDFGLARLHHEGGDNTGACPMTEYVCTRWFRAPEVLCSWTDYSKAVDIWSVGCIFAEMLRRKPLFPGKNTQHQLQLIISCLGTPEKDALKRIPNEKCRKFIESLPATGGRSLEEATNGASKEALDLVSKTLRFSPDRRSTVEQCLEAPYLSQLHCPEDEPTASPLDMAAFEFERRKIDIAVLREEIFSEALLYHPQKREQYHEEQIRSGKVVSIFDYRILGPGESQYTSDEEDAG